MESASPKSEWTVDSIEFAPWETTVADDELALASLSYVGTTKVAYADFELELPTTTASAACDLEAIFFSKEKHSAVGFSFRKVYAFRVLDEMGLAELWRASADRPRPTQSTFRVRGHRWQIESEPQWVLFAEPGGFSYLVATENDCLEVVCSEPPVIKIERAIYRPISREK